MFAEVDITLQHKRLFSTRMVVRRVRSPGIEFKQDGGRTLIPLIEP
jgi:hypothetical protein